MLRRETALGADTRFPGLVAGEYVTVYAGSVLNPRRAAEAEEVLRLFAELMAWEDGANG